MAKVLGISRSGYYQYLTAGLSTREEENQRLLEKIRTIHQNSHETYGSPRIHVELKMTGETCSRKRVARLMKNHHLSAKMVKRLKETTRRSERPFFVAPDLIQQDFTSDQPNKAWVSDITYIQTQTGWSYCAIVLDLFSRKVVGLAIDDHMRADLILRALRQALTHRKPPRGVIHHSDKGSQYTSHALKLLADAYGIQLSTGKVGNAFDNAVAESFFHTLKTERVHWQHYRNLEEAKLDIFYYIYGFYNQTRRHSTLGYLSPSQFEHQFHATHTYSLPTVH